MNEQNLKPFKQNDGRTADRAKGGLMAGYVRLLKKGQAAAIHYMIVKVQAEQYFLKVKNTQIGPKRAARLKEHAHALKIERNRLEKAANKVMQRRQLLADKYGIIVEQ